MFGFTPETEIEAWNGIAFITKETKEVQMQNNLREMS